MAFNDQVRIKVKDKTRVNVWAHKGLFKRDSGYQDRHGVHLNFRGTIKYFPFSTGGGKTLCCTPPT